MRENPYTKLKRIAREYCIKIRAREYSCLHYYKTEDIKNLALNELYYSTRTADELGYETHLKVTKQGLEIQHIEKMPQTPWELL